MDENDTSAQKTPAFLIVRTLSKPDQTRLLSFPSHRHNWCECIGRDFVEYHMCWDNDLILLEYYDGGLLLSWDWWDGIGHMDPVSTHDGFSGHCFSAVELNSLEPKVAG